RQLGCIQMSTWFTHPHLLQVETNPGITSASPSSPRTPVQDPFPGTTSIIDSLTSVQVRTQERTLACGTLGRWQREFGWARSIPRREYASSAAVARVDG